MTDLDNIITITMITISSLYSKLKKDKRGKRDLKTKEGYDSAKQHFLF
jgi:hypothetical protein